MAFYGHKGDAGECHWTPYNIAYHDHDFPSLSYSSYEIAEPELIEYNPPSDNFSSYEYNSPGLDQYEPIDYHSSSSAYTFYDYTPTNYYSMYNYTEPKVLLYEPETYAKVHFPPELETRIFYSTAKLDGHTDFEEYDPTPYGGGYDQAKTYGAPLPPSNETCYPRSTPRSDDVPVPDFSSSPSPYAKDGKPLLKPVSATKPIESKPDSDSKDGDKVISDADVDKPLGQDKDNDFNSGNRVPGDDVGTYIDQPLGQDRVNDFDSGNHDDIFQNGLVEGHGNGIDGDVPRVPYGSGLESMDLCESIFGYWPCWAKRNVTRHECCDQECRNIDNPWQSAADYLFGSPMQNHGWNDGGYRDYGQNYAGYYQQQQT